MSLGLYMDVHVPLAITRGLRRRGVDALTAQQDGATRLPDPHLLNRAMELGRLFFSQDEDLVAEVGLAVNAVASRSRRSSTPANSTSPLAVALPTWRPSPRPPAPKTPKARSSSCNPPRATRPERLTAPETGKRARRLARLTAECCQPNRKLSVVCPHSVAPV